jgi:hypothetical protein
MVRALVIYGMKSGTSSKKYDVAEATPIIETTKGNDLKRISN